MRKLNNAIKHDVIPSSLEVLQSPFDKLIPVWDNPALLTYRIFVDDEFGDDNNDGMSWLTPFKTLTQANRFLPTDLNGAHALIYLHPGTYSATEFFKNNGVVRLLYGGACMINEAAGAYGAYCKAGAVNPARNNNQVIIVSKNLAGFTLIFSGSASYSLDARNFSFSYDTPGYTAWDKMVLRPDESLPPTRLLTIDSSFTSEGGLSLDLRNTQSAGICFISKFNGFIRSCKISGGTGQASTASNYWRGAFLGEGLGESSSFELSSINLGWHTNFQPPGGINWQVSGIRSFFSSAQAAHLFTINFNTSSFLYEQGSLPDAAVPQIRLEATARGSYYYHSSILSLVDNSLNPHLTKNYADNISKSFVNPSIKSVANNVILKTSASAPLDAYLDASNLVFYLDEVTGKLKLKLKYSDGTIKSGEIALT